LTYSQMKLARGRLMTMFPSVTVYAVKVLSTGMHLGFFL